jgi:hypothetical protein
MQASRLQLARSRDACATGPIRILRSSLFKAMSIVIAIKAGGGTGGLAYCRPPVALTAVFSISHFTFFIFHFSFGMFIPRQNQLENDH